MATSTRRRSSSDTTSADPKLSARGSELQPFGTLRRLPIGLSDDAKKQSCELLNEILADIERVTARDVKDLGERLLDGPLSLVALGPKSPEVRLPEGVRV